MRLLYGRRKCASLTIVINISLLLLLLPLSLLMLMLSIISIIFNTKSAASAASARTFRHLFGMISGVNSDHSAHECGCRTKKCHHNDINAASQRMKLIEWFVEVFFNLKPEPCSFAKLHNELNRLFKKVRVAFHLLADCLP